MLIAWDDSAIAWMKLKDVLCFVKFVADRLPTPFLEECVKAISQRGAKREEVLLRGPCWNSITICHYDVGTHETFMVPKSELGTDIGPHR